MQDIINEVDSTGSGTVELQDLLNLMATRLKGTDSEDDVKEAFKVRAL